MIVFLLALVSAAHSFTLNTPTNADMKGWQAKRLLVHTNLDACTPTGFNMGVELVEAMKVWSSVPTADITLSRGKITTATAATAGAGTETYIPVVICDAAFSATSNSNPNLIPAYTVITVDGSSNRVSYGYVVLNAEAGTLGNVTGMKAAKARAVMAHEMGHLIGLGHTNDQNSLMHNDILQKNEARLSQDDINGASYLYPRSEPARGTFLGCATIASKNGGTPPMQILMSILAFIALMGVAREFLKRGSN